MAKLDRLMKQATDHFKFKNFKSVSSMSPQTALKQAMEYIELKTGETFIATAVGVVDSKGVAVLIATNKRLVLLARKIGGFDLEIIQYTNISSIEMSESSWGQSIQVLASGNSISIKWIKFGQVSKLVEHVEAMIGKKAELPLLISSDVPVEIKKLAELKEQGILTEDEFQSKKQELLSRM